MIVGEVSHPPGLADLCRMQKRVNAKHNQVLLLISTSESAARCFVVRCAVPLSCAQGRGHADDALSTDNERPLDEQGFASLRSMKKTSRLRNCKQSGTSWTRGNRKGTKPLSCTPVSESTPLLYTAASVSTC
jgi:hypothetical protein